MRSPVTLAPSGTSRHSLSAMSDLYLLSVQAMHVLVALSNPYPALHSEEECFESVQRRNRDFELKAAEDFGLGPLFKTHALWGQSLLQQTTRVPLSLA